MTRTYILDLLKETAQNATAKTLFAESIQIFGHEYGTLKMFFDAYEKMTNAEILFRLLEWKGYVLDHVDISNGSVCFAMKTRKGEKDIIFYTSVEATGEWDQDGWRNYSGKDYEIITKEAAEKIAEMIG